jgi:hypothetical protein
LGKTTEIKGYWETPQFTEETGKFQMTVWGSNILPHPDPGKNNRNQGILGNPTIYRGDTASKFVNRSASKFVNRTASKFVNRTASKFVREFFQKKVPPSEKTFGLNFWLGLG